MEGTELFTCFEKDGCLLLPQGAAEFSGIPWSKHPSFEGVELKHLVTAAQTGGQFSFHLVRIAPGKEIGKHIHKEQLETHEVIAGGGVCIHGTTELRYRAGVVTIFPKNMPHSVTAGSEGLYLFAKFLPALC